jgi:tRNA uridine 5-carboxymethylaminomethyl modification enzyme
MFTSRAEYRLSLREDNADLRLTEIGRSLGLVDNARWMFFCKKKDAVSRETMRLKDAWVSPKHASAQSLATLLGQELSHEASLADILKRPTVTYALLSHAYGGAIPELDADPNLNQQIQDQVEISIKYAGYIDRQALEIARQEFNEGYPLPELLDYSLVRGLSKEVQQKLGAQKPETLGHAARISGVTPAAISLLLVHLKRGIGKSQESA